MATIKTNIEKREYPSVEFQQTIIFLAFVFCILANIWISSAEQEYLYIDVSTIEDKIELEG